MRSRDWNETFVTDISDSDDSAIVIPSRRLDFDEQSVLGYYVSPWLLRQSLAMSVFCVVFVQSNKSRKCKDTKDVPNVYPLNIFYFPPTKDMFLPVSVCLSVSKITQNACMDLDEILRVDRCRDMDELMNF